MLMLSRVLALGLLVSACGGSKPAPSTPSAPSKRETPYEKWVAANPNTRDTVPTLAGDVTCWRGMVEPDGYEMFLRRAVRPTTEADGSISVEIEEDMMNFFGGMPPQRYVSVYSAKGGAYADKYKHFEGVAKAQKELDTGSGVVTDVVGAMYIVAGFQAATFEYVRDGKLKFVGILFHDGASKAGYTVDGAGLNKVLNSFGTMTDEKVAKKVNKGELAPIELAECEKLYATFPAAGRNW